MFHFPYLLRLYSFYRHKNISDLFIVHKPCHNQQIVRLCTSLLGLDALLSEQKEQFDIEKKVRNTEICQISILIEFVNTVIQ